MCSRAVRCWDRESVQHRTTSYGLRYDLPSPMYWNPMTRRRSLPDCRPTFLYKITEELLVTRQQSTVPYALSEGEPLYAPVIRDVWR